MRASLLASAIASTLGCNCFLARGAPDFYPSAEPSWRFWVYTYVCPGDQGRIAEARSLLQSVYDRFSEGFETADLKTAKAHLDSMQ